MRRRLLSDGQIGKYLKYAFGEIILVVLGILIALSANNYNERSKALAQSSAYLNDMMEDLAADTLYLSRMLPALEAKLQLEEWLLNKTTFDETDLDSIQLAVSYLDWTFNMHDRSYQSVQNSSEAKLLGYEQLYREASKYYISTQERINQNNQIELQQGSQSNDFEDVMQANLLITTRAYQDYSGFQVKLDLPTQDVVKDFEAIKSSLGEIRTRNTLNEEFARHNYIYITLYFCDIEAKKLMQLIQSAIKGKSL